MKHLWLHIRLLTVAFIWGVSWTAGRLVATDFTPVTAAWISYVIAIGLFLLWLKSTGNMRIPTKLEWNRLVYIGFFSTFLYQVFFMFGMKYTAAGDASLMITFNPIITALLAIPFLGEKMTKRLASGLIIALSGVIIIFIYSPNVDIPATTRMLGDALIILAALSWASSTIFMKKAMTTTTSDSTEPLTPLQLTVWASVVGFFILTPWSAYELIDSGMPEFNQDIVLSILFLAVFSTVISYVWFAEGIQTIGANRAALYVYLVPPFGILAVWWLLDELLGLSLLAAFVLIVGGVAIAQSEKHDESEPSGIIHGD